MALNGVCAGVTQQKVAGLLQERQPEILTTDDPAQVSRFEDRVSGAAVEVILLVGTNPDPGPVHNLAVEAIALQTASEIEYAEFPEQQAAGDIGRGYHLHQRYLELLARLRDFLLRGGIGTGAQGTWPSPLAPRGSFPPPEPDIDPARRGSGACGW